MNYFNKTAKINELKKELEQLKACKPRLLSTSVEDVDDIYQQALEWNYEYEALTGEMERIRTMSYKDFDKEFNSPIEEEQEESKHGDEWELEDYERGL